MIELAVGFFAGIALLIAVVCATHAGARRDYETNARLRDRRGETQTERDDA